MSKYKKLHFIRANQTKHGGAENYLVRLSNELKKQNIEHEIIHSKLPKFLSSWVKALIFNVQVCLNKKDTFYFSLERITCADIYRAGDGVHKEFLKTKRRRLNPLNLVYLYLEKRCFKNSKKIIANSNMVKEQIIKAYDIPSKNIEVIYNGVNIKSSKYDNSFAKLSKEFDMDRDKKIILFVGSGFERKGGKEFLQILSKLKEKNYQAFVVGKEKRLNYYKQMAKELDIEDFVTFTGARDDVDDFYIISDIFLFPTIYEPFSNVILEAMSFQNAVITTKQNGASEILNQEYVMQAPNDFSIVEKMDNLLRNSQELDIIKEKNFKIVQNFTIEKNAKETMKVINEYLH